MQTVTSRLRLITSWLFGLILLSGCIRSTDSSPSQAPIAQVPTAAADILWSDANSVMSDVCFEAADSLSGRVFVLRYPEDLIAFYDQIDNSLLCRHPVTRYPFDFGNGNVLVGLWGKARGCRAWYEILDVMRNDSQRSFVVKLHLVTEGSCNYELLRPFWIGLDGLADYSVQIILHQ